MILWDGLCDTQIVYMQSIGQNFALGEHLSTASSVKSASVSDNVKNLNTFDAAGNEIAADFDSATGTMHFAAALDKVTYDYDTGFNGVMMDVTLYATENVASNGGDCNVAFGMTAMFAVLLMLLKKIPKYPPNFWLRG